MIVKRAVPDERTVIRMRHEYFIEGKTYKEIAEQHGISRSAVSNAVNGKSWFYEQIKDDIPQEIKDERKNRSK